MKRLLIALVGVGAILGFGQANAPSSKPQASTWQEPKQPEPLTDAKLISRWDALLTISAFSTSNTFANAAKLEAFKVGAQLMDRGYCVPERGRQWEKCRS